MSVHFKIQSGILTLVTGKASFITMKTQKVAMYTWTEVCTGVHSLNPDHCRPHNHPAAVVDGGVTASGLRMLKGIQASGLLLPQKGTCLSRNERY